LAAATHSLHEYPVAALKINTLCVGLARGLAILTPANPPQVNGVSLALVSRCVKPIKHVAHIHVGLQ